MRRGENGPRCKVEMTDSCSMSPESNQALELRNIHRRGHGGHSSAGGFRRLSYQAQISGHCRMPINKEQEQKARMHLSGAGNAALLVERLPYMHLGFYPQHFINWMC